MSYWPEVKCAVIGDAFTGITSFLLDATKTDVLPVAFHRTLGFRSGILSFFHFLHLPNGKTVMLSFWDIGKSHTFLYYNNDQVMVPMRHLMLYNAPQKNY